MSDAVKTRIKIRDAVAVEMARQKSLWGEQNHEDIVWLPILIEEVGEVSKAINDCFHSIKHVGAEEAVYEELVHTAAVAQSWLEAIERRTA